MNLSHSLCVNTLAFVECRNFITYSQKPVTGSYLSQINLIHILSHTSLRTTLISSFHLFLCIPAHMAFQLTFSTHLSSLPCVLNVSPVSSSLRASTKNTWTAFVELTEGPFQAPDPNPMDFECGNSYRNILMLFLPESSKTLLQDFIQP